MNKMFLNLIGGGAGYFMLIKIAAIGALWVYVQILQASNENLKADLKEAESAVSGAQIAIKSQAKQSIRKDEIQRRADHAATQIEAAPDGYDCAASEPVQRALDWVQTFESEAAAKADSD